MKKEVNNGFLSYPKLSSATSIQSMEPLNLSMHGFLVFEVESLQREASLLPRPT
jgi:hypothetical protein